MRLFLTGTSGMLCCCQLPVPQSSVMNGHWNAKLSDDLQQTANGIFERDTTGELCGYEFSLTIADPNLEGCPLVGCSTGFTIPDQCANEK